MLLAMVGHYIVGSFVSMHENLRLTKGDNFYAHFGPLRGIQGRQNHFGDYRNAKKLPFLAVLLYLTTTTVTQIPHMGA